VRPIARALRSNTWAGESHGGSQPSSRWHRRDPVSGSDGYANHPAGNWVGGDESRRAAIGVDVADIVGRRGEKAGRVGRDDDWIFSKKVFISKKSLLSKKALFSKNVFFLKKALFSKNRLFRKK
jgi:hypothetical protein